MNPEPSPPAESAALFPGADGNGRSLSIPLPPGRIVGRGGRGAGEPVLWVSDAPAPPGLWARARADHPRSGLWPLLLGGGDEVYRRWLSGELIARETSPADHDPAAVLAQLWHEHTEVDEEDPEAGDQDLEDIAPYGAHWPGLASATAPTADPGQRADEIAEEVIDAYPAMRLGLVAAPSGPDALTAVGWAGAVNYSETAPLSAVLRDWGRRFGVRVVAANVDTLYLSVAAPPADEQQALAVAAEHFAFCPDNIWQGGDPPTLSAYALRLIGDTSWTFWWD